VTTHSLRFTSRGVLCENLPGSTRITYRPDYNVWKHPWAVISPSVCLSNDWTRSGQYLLIATDGKSVLQIHRLYSLARARVFLTSVHDGSHTVFLPCQVQVFQIPNAQSAIFAPTNGSGIIREHGATPHRLFVALQGAQNITRINIPHFKC
jgi:hypothetical protein